MRSGTRLFITGLILQLLSVFLVSGQNQKEILFKKTLNEVVTALVKKDSARILKYIDKSTGVFVINRPGVYDTYSNYEKLNFNQQFDLAIYFTGDIKSSGLKYATLPEYSCEYERWSKTGCFVDTTKTDHLLSNTAKSLVQYLELEISEKTIAEFKELELKSRRVVMVSQDGNSLILYLSYIKKKWYLSIIDQVTGDCSA